MNLYCLFMEDGDGYTFTADYLLGVFLRYEDAEMYRESFTRQEMRECGDIHWRDKRGFRIDTVEADALIEVPIGLERER
jgi:hypothetical protein